MKKAWLIALILVLLTSAAYLAYRQLARTALLRRRQRDFSVVSRPATASEFALGLVDAGSASLITPMKFVGGTPIPMTQKSYYSKTQQLAFSDSLTSLRRRFGGLIRQAAQNSDVPAWLLEAKMLVENEPGNPKARSSASPPAVGLMQIKKLSATEMVVIARKKGLLSEAEIAVLRRRLGAAKTAAVLRADNSAQIITETDLEDPELNLQLGAIFLSVYLDESQEGAAYRYDKASVRFNQGYYAYARGTALTGTTDDLLARLGGEADAYLRKMLGKNGTVELVLT